MANTGNVFPGTGANDAGIGATAWTTPGNITADDAADATCNAAASSQYLVAKAFAGAVANIPDSAIIKGITVRIEASEHSGGTEVVNVRLQDAAGALTGTGKTFTASGTAKAVYTLGAVSDLWGITAGTLTGANVKDADFGPRIWFATAHDVRIDYVTVAYEWEVRYTLTGTGAGVTANCLSALRKAAVIALAGVGGGNMVQAVATARASTMTGTGGGDGSVVPSVGRSIGLIGSGSGNGSLAVETNRTVAIIGAGGGDASVVTNGGDAYNGLFTGTGGGSGTIVGIGSGEVDDPRHGATGGSAEVPADGGFAVQRDFDLHFRSW